MNYKDVDGQSSKQYRERAFNLRSQHHGNVCSDRIVKQFKFVKTLYKSTNRLTFYIDNMFIVQFMKNFIQYFGANIVDKTVLVSVALSFTYLEA